MGALALCAPALSTQMPDLADGSISLYPVIGDNMEPTLRVGRSMVLARAVDGYEGEAMYVLDGGVVYQADACIGRPGCVRVYSHNKVYVGDQGPDVYTREEFAGIVIAKVIADLRLYESEDQKQLWRYASEVQRGDYQRSAT
jgi:hypothetical protein